MLGLIPAAGQGARIQPLAFSKELLPVGLRCDGAAERPRAVSEYLVERLLRAGADRLIFVISPTKSDIVRYFGAQVGGAAIAYAVQPHPGGLCDALFRAAPFVHPSEGVAIGLPDTIWFPVDGLGRLPPDRLAFLLFEVERPAEFDAVIVSLRGRVECLQVKHPRPATSWIWGALRMPGQVFQDLFALWRERDREDEYLGTLVNAWIAQGGEATAVKAGEAYVDVGSLGGYRAAMRLLAERELARVR